MQLLLLPVLPESIILPFALAVAIRCLLGHVCSCSIGSVLGFGFGFGYSTLEQMFPCWACVLFMPRLKAVPPHWPARNVLGRQSLYYIFRCFQEHAQIRLHFRILIQLQHKSPRSTKLQQRP